MSAERRPLVVELIGLPGTGKSTVARSLVAGSQGRIQQARLRRWRYAPYLAMNALRVLGPFASQYHKMGQRRRNKFSSLLQLQTLGDVVAGKHFPGAEVILLDQGPVYLLSKLHRTIVAAPGSDGRIFERFWNRTLARWADRLDLVVVLEATDDELYRRIRRRGKAHVLVGGTHLQATQLFQRTRAGHQHILAELSSRSDGPAIVRVDTERTSETETVRQVLGAVGRGAEPVRSGRVVGGEHG
jgi:hypothetical protein